MQNDKLIIITVEENPELTLEEVCHACGVAPEFIQELIEYGAIEPHGLTIESSHFDLNHVRRIKTIVNLQEDLEVNVPGAILVVDLMEEIEELRQQVELFKKQFNPL